MSTGTRGSTPRSTDHRTRPSSARATPKKHKARRPAKPDPDPDPGEDLWEIWDILDEKKDRHGRVSYRVEWKGIDPATGRKYEPSWEPAANVTEDAIADWRNIKRERAAKSSSRASTTSRASSQNSSPVALPGAGRKRSLERAADGDSSDLESAEFRALKRRRPGAPARLPTLRPELGWRPPSIEIELPADPAFDPSEYRAVTESQSTQATQGASQQAPAPAPVAVAATRDVTAIIPDSQEVSGSEIANSGSRRDTQQSQSHAQVSEPASTSEIPSHQPQPELYPLNEEVERLNSASFARANELPPDSAAPASQLEAPPSGSQPSFPEPVFLTQIPFSFGNRGHTSPAVEAPSSQPEDVEDATAPQHQHATAGGSGASSQAAQIVDRPWVHSQELSSQSQAGDFSVYSDGDVVPQSVPQQSGEQQASQESSQALSELNGNTRVSSSFREREAAKSQPQSPIMDDDASAGTPPRSAREKFRQVQQQFSSQTHFDFDTPAAPSHDPLPSAPAPPSEPHMAGNEFSLPLVSPMLLPSVEMEREHTPPVFGPKHNDVPIPAVVPADTVVNYSVAEEPATLDPSALTLSIEHEPARGNSVPTDDGLPSDDIFHEHDAALLADETSKPLGQAESQEYTRNILPFIRTGPNEHLVTLPLANNMRSLYYDITREYLHDIKAYTAAFAESSTKLTPALVSRVDAMLSRLYDICDLPPFLETIQQVAGTNLAPKHIRGSNSKFAFVGEFIEVLKQLDSLRHILILARPGRTIELLSILVEYEVSRPSESDGSVDPSVPYVSVKSTRENMHALPADYDAVIAFDHTFRPSMLPKKSDGSMPMVMALVISASVQHIDLRISEKPPELERKNMLLMALCRARQFVENPEDQNAAEPHTVASSFARHLESPNDDFYWTPQELPDLIFDDINPSSQIDGNPSSWETNGTADREMSRKRSRDIVEELAPKRRKTSAHLTATTDLAQVSDAVRRLLRNDGIVHQEAHGSETPTVVVPVSRLETISAELAKLRSELDSTRKQSQRFRDLSDRAQKEVQSWTASVNSLQPKFMAALRDRGIMKKERDASRKELESLSTQFDQTTKEKSKLAEENVELKRKLSEARDTLMSSENPDIASMTRMQKEFEEAKEKNAELEKKVGIVQENLDFVRERYQQASNSGAGLSVEKTELERRIEALDRKADENVFRVNQVQAQSESRELARLLGEQKQLVRDREAELGRVKEQLGALRNGRRETRQSSVPRSPRLGSLGVLSPRNAAGRGGSANNNNNQNNNGNSASGTASRGTSPTAAGALDALGPGLFGQNTGNGRYAHLRD